MIQTAQQKKKSTDKIQLTDFIRENTKQIISEWEAFAQTLTPAANDMTPLALRNHINGILAFIIQDIASPQTKAEQIEKSHGEKERESDPTAAETHAALRLAGGFHIDQMVSEWRSLRASVIKLWSAANITMNSNDIIDLTRFNEAIDQELAESVSHYTKKVSYSKDLFIGILSHELRNPLNVITMASQLQLKDTTPKERQPILAKQIAESAARATSIINDLLDVTRARFGSGLPVVRVPMDMGSVAQQLVGEMQIAHPTRKIILRVLGDVKGDWDQARIGQIFSNLIGNAMQYGLKNSPIDINVKGTSEDVVISIHNMGEPIPPEKIETIFESLTRAVTDNGEHDLGVNLGLGLYITKEIVVSHGGTIGVTSSMLKGTTFTVCFPRATH